MKKIAVLAGDGIGPEVMTQTLRVIDAMQLPIKTETGLIGGAAYDHYNCHFPQQTLELCLQSDAVLFGSVGGPLEDSHIPKWKDCEKNAILALRKSLNLSVNLRPARLFEALIDISPLKNEIIANGVDLLIIRELLGDIYFGKHEQHIENNIRVATDEARYDEDQIKNIMHKAFNIAMTRNKTLTSVDKANVLQTSQLWRDIANEVSTQYPEVTLKHMLVDNCAMQLILNPSQFDTIVTANLFGDILSDAASALPGSLGLMPSASFSHNGPSLYEPSGGSAPEIANKNMANPTAQILSAALLLRHSLGMEVEANRIENAVIKTLIQGHRTQDIFQNGDHLCGTTEFTDHIIHHL